MGRINRLPPHVASQIAAGEVIENPASVVKELVENSIDAGAGRITIETLEGGRRMIRVSDDGEGITRADLPLAVVSHATSKITALDDLQALGTLGFRGEALASIAAVSRLTIVSRSREEMEGGRLKVEFGRVGAVETVGCRVGTVVTVEDLFEALPARQKFLKSPSAEQGRINLAARKLAAAHPHLHFELTANGRRVFVARPRSGASRLSPLLGRGAEGLVPIEGRIAGVELEGYVSPREEARSSPSSFHIFLNGRPIKSSTIWRAVMDACSGILMKGSYPAGGLFLTVDPKLVDVNCHPAKQEVRFADSNAVFRLVYHAVRRGMEGRPFTPPSGPDRPRECQPLLLDRSHGPEKDPMEEVAAPWLEVREPPPPSGAHFKITASPVSSRDKNRHLLEQAKVLGQYRASYILAEGEEGLLIVDQHACHEAILFKRLSSELERGGTIARQLLAPPLVMELSDMGLDLRSFPTEELLPLGFEVEEFGQGGIIVRAVPELLAVAACDNESLKEILISAAKRGDFSSEPLRVITSAMACRAAVKAGTPLSPQEMEALLRQAVEEGVSHCPHGRPIAAEFPLSKLLRMLGRE